MKLYIFYRPNSEHERTVEQYVHDFTHQTGKAVTLVNVDSKEGTEKAKLYDIVAYPSAVATTDDGVMLQEWRSGILPTISEASYYAEET